jgi:hypothetical protein
MVELMTPISRRPFQGDSAKGAALGAGALPASGGSSSSAGEGDWDFEHMGIA